MLYLTVNAISLEGVVTNLGFTIVKRAVKVYFPFEKAGATTLSPYSLTKTLSFATENHFFFTHPSIFALGTFSISRLNIN